ncbi:MAG: tRNA (adenosine(37)-N6)-threonylcarbamoyltransferase complex ATPase subunit type 1 TsaE [Bacteroidota bacterium]|jgi:tRNA threonylcarbamoyladenosine biosynthesis protein TsaE
MLPLLEHSFSEETIHAQIGELSQVLLCIEAMGAQEFYVLRGEVGAGKTTLSQQLLASWGIADAVMSPTFSLVNSYTLPNGTKLYHHDWYRINEAGELFDAGIEEILNEFPSVHLIEWPEIGDFLLRDLLVNFNAKVLEIQIEHQDNQRKYRLLQYH